MSTKYTKDQIDFIIHNKEKKDLPWKKIVEIFNKKFQANSTIESMRSTYKRWKNYKEDEKIRVTDDGSLSSLEPAYSEDQLAFIFQLKDERGLTWNEVAELYNKKFKTNKHPDAISACYKRNKEYFTATDGLVRTLKSTYRARKTSSYNAKENRAILEEWSKRDDLLEKIEQTILNIGLKKESIPKAPKKNKNKKNMTLELLFSDVHYGKFIDSVEGNFVNVDVIRTRVRRIAESVIKEISMENQYFNVERLIVAMLGDIIENANFHGMESTKACEFSSSRQIQEAIQSIYEDLLVPLAKTGLQIDVPCVTGNHDRWDHNKTYVKPGEDNATYIIYKTLEMMCRMSGLTNVKFDIPTGLYTSIEVYGNHVLYEHGDELQSLNRNTMLTHMYKRQGQLNRVLSFFRVGHWHEPVQYGQGKIMVNGSVPGQDSYADSKGFWSEPVQILNYYVQTEKRSTCFYKSFPIYLNYKKE